MPKEKYDYEILEDAMNNAYEIIVGTKTFDKIMDDTGECALPFDIRDEEPDVEGMIEFLTLESDLGNFRLNPKILAGA